MTDNNGEAADANDSPRKGKVTIQQYCHPPHVLIFVTNKDLTSTPSTN